MKASFLFQTIVIFLLSAVLLFVSYKLFRQDTGLDLNQTTRVAGHVVRAVDTTQTTDNERLKDRHILVLQLDKLNQRLGIYRMSQDYSKQLEVLRPGTPVTVHYNSKITDAINLDVYQVEAGNQVLFHYSEYEENHRFAAILTGLIGIGVFIGGVRGFRKKR